MNFVVVLHTFLSIFWIFQYGKKAKSFGNIFCVGFWLGLIMSILLSFIMGSMFNSNSGFVYDFIQSAWVAYSAIWTRSLYLARNRVSHKKWSYIGFAFASLPLWGGLIFGTIRISYV